ncbi:MAG: LCP family protein [Armatimonadia bacterium]
MAVSVLAVGAAARYERTPAPAHAGDVLQPLPQPFAGQERVRIVMIGADDREERGRSDTLMVLQINPANGRAALVSIPRDLRVDIPGHGMSKINHAYRYGGPRLTQQTVEELLSLPTDGVIKVNLQGFVKAVDILGGVVLDVEDQEGQGRGMNYDCPQDDLVIHLKPGRQRLNGYKAMGYVRYRKSNIPGAGGTDFDRAKRQQKFIKAMIAQKVRVTKLPALVKAGEQVIGCVRTSLTSRQVLDLARFIRGLQDGQMKSFTLPASDSRLNGVYYAELDQAEFAAMMTGMESFLAGSGTAVAEEGTAGTAEVSGPVRVEVLNGSGKPGAAKAAADKLTAAGFSVVKVGNAPSIGYTENTILYRGDVGEGARRAAGVVGGGSIEQDPSGPAPEGSAQVQVTVGTAFQMN